MVQARPELDDLEAREAFAYERVVLHLRREILATLRHCEDHAAGPGHLAAGCEEHAGPVALLEERDVRTHPPVDLGEGALVSQ